MKFYMKIILGFFVFFVFLLGLGLLGIMLSVPKNTDKSNQNTIPNVTPQNNKNIAISYSVVAKQSIEWSSGSFISEQKSDSGKVFLEITMTIKNNGYSDGFSTNPFLFNLIADNIKYNYDSTTHLLDKWDTIDVLDGGSYTGTIVFQVPSTASSFTMESNQLSFTNFNIIWTKT